LLLQEGSEVMKKQKLQSPNLLTLKWVKKETAKKILLFFNLDGWMEKLAKS
jgi:hypothetical protein